MAFHGLFLPQCGPFCDSNLRRHSSSSQQLISLRAAKPVVCSASPAVDKAPLMNGTGTENFIRPHLRKLAAYTPIEPFEILSKRLGRAPADIIKLDANENPYGPPREVLEALGDMPFPNIYPDPETRRLRSALAEMNDIPMEHLLVRQNAIKNELNPTSV
jgi:histidinol-phosphate aminotransferase